VIDLSEWLRLARQGDDEAYGMLVENCQTPVYNLCYRMLNDPMEAEDAAQETFWRAYQALNRYDPTRPFLTWLLSIAAHYCIDQQRRRRLPIVDIELLSEDGLPDSSPTPEKISAMEEQQRLLHGLIAGLSPQDRAAIILRYWYDFSEEEIAQSLSLTVSAVKSRLHRARLALAQRWPAQSPSEDEELSILSRSEDERRQHVSPAF
jgi:RNA polymerase sigma-70 factor (ECF subfamily)